jgi:hypothetical protein
VSTFEYVSILLSIVAAIGMAEVLSNLAALGYRRETIASPGLYVALSVVVLFLLIQGWWGYWAYRDRMGWSFADLVLALAPFVGLVAIAYSLRPTFGPTTDLSELYFARRTLFYPIAAAVVIVFGIADSRLGDEPVFYWENLVRASAVAVHLTLAYSSRSWVHWAAMVYFLSGLAAFVYSATPYVE